METTVNERIKFIIVESKLTVNLFAKKIGVSQPTLKSIVDGNTKPSFDTLEKILKSYPIDAQWLILGIGQMEKTSKSEVIPNNASAILRNLEMFEERIKALEEEKKTSNIAADVRLKYGKH